MIILLYLEINLFEIGLDQSSLLLDHTLLQIKVSIQSQNFFLILKVLISIFVELFKYLLVLAVELDV